MATQIDRMAADNINRNNVAAQALESLVNQQGQVYQAAQANLEGAGKDAKLVTETENLARAEAASRTQNFAAKIGTDPSQANFLLENLVKQSTELFQRQQEVGKRLENAGNIAGILDNPLQFLADFALYDFNKIKKEGIDQQVQSVNNQINTLNNVTQQTAQTMLAISQPKTVESALASGRVAEAEVNAKVHALQIDALRTNMEGVSKINALRNSSMDIALRARDQQLQEAGLAIARQNAALQAQGLILAMEERKERIALKKEEASSRGDMLAAVNAGRALNGGLPPFRTFEEMQTVAAMDPKQKEFIAQQYMTGITAATTGQATLAGTPYDALKYVKGTGAKFSDGRSRVIEYLNSAQGVVSNNPALMAGVKKESDLAALINKQSVEGAKQMLNNVSSGKNNIYAPPPIQALLEDGTFGSSFIAQNYLAPMAKGGVTDMNLSSIINMLLNDIKGGKISLAQADKEVGFLAEKVKGYNNSIYRYNATAGLPNMNNFRVTLDDTTDIQNLVNRAFSPGTVGSNLPAGMGVYSMFGGTSETVVDIADPTARAAYLNKRLAQTIKPVLRQQAESKSKTGVK